jgi:hypothetical protein
MALDDQRQRIAGIEGQGRARVADGPLLVARRQAGSQEEREPACGLHAATPPALAAKADKSTRHAAANLMPQV